jgi:hypothetical protein
MANRKPNHADAELMLKLYDLRREPVMRAARKAILGWTPKSVDDVRAISSFDHPNNEAWRQVSSYFEYAFGFARHGIVPADFLAEYNGEGLLLFAKVEPFLKEYRAATSASAFGNAEWVTTHSKWAKRRLDLFRARLAGASATARPEKPAKPEKRKNKRNGS